MDLQRHNEMTKLSRFIDNGSEMSILPYSQFTKRNRSFLDQAFHNFSYSFGVGLTNAIKNQTAKFVLDFFSDDKITPEEMKEEFGFSLPKPTSRKYVQYLKDQRSMMEQVEASMKNTGKTSFMAGLVGSISGALVFDPAMLAFGLGAASLSRTASAGLKSFMGMPRGITATAIGASEGLSFHAIRSRAIRELGSKEEVQLTDATIDIMGGAVFGNIAALSTIPSFKRAKIMGKKPPPTMIKPDPGYVAPPKEIQNVAKINLDNTIDKVVKNKEATILKGEAQFKKSYETPAEKNLKEAADIEDFSRAFKLELHPGDKEAIATGKHFTQFSVEVQEMFSEKIENLIVLSKNLRVNKEFTDELLGSLKIKKLEDAKGFGVNINNMTELQISQFSLNKKPLKDLNPYMDEIIKDPFGSVYGMLNEFIINPHKKIGDIVDVMSLTTGKAYYLGTPAGVYELFMDYKYIVNAMSNDVDKALLFSKRYREMVKAITEMHVGEGQVGKDLFDELADNLKSSGLKDYSKIDQLPEETFTGLFTFNRRNLNIVPDDELVSKIKVLDDKLKNSPVKGYDKFDSVKPRKVETVTQEAAPKEPSLADDLYEKSQPNTSLVNRAATTVEHLDKMSKEQLVGKVKIVKMPRKLSASEIKKRGLTRIVNRDRPKDKRNIYKGLSFQEVMELPEVKAMREAGVDDEDILNIFIETIEVSA